MIEVSTRRSFASHLSGATILRGWARSALGDEATGVSWIKAGIDDYRASGSILGLPFFLALQADALHLAGHTADALEAITEAETLVQRFEQRNWSAELHRLRGVLLADLGAEANQVDALFFAAIRTATEEKSVSLMSRAETSYAEYRRQLGS
jgi:predicted ATPase